MRWPRVDTTGEQGTELRVVRIILGIVLGGLTMIACHLMAVLPLCLMEEHEFWRRNVLVMWFLLPAVSGFVLCVFTSVLLLRLLGLNAGCVLSFAFASVPVVAGIVPLWAAAAFRSDAEGLYFAYALALWAVSGALWWDVLRSRAAGDESYLEAGPVEEERDGAAP